VAQLHELFAATRWESDDPEFQTRYTEQLRRIVRHLAEHDHSR
jgi:hypothetical protein